MTELDTMLMTLFYWNFFWKVHFEIGLAFIVEVYIHS